MAILTQAELALVLIGQEGQILRGTDYLQQHLNHLCFGFQCVVENIGFVHSFDLHISGSESILLLEL